MLMYDTRVNTQQAPYADYPDKTTTDLDVKFINRTGLKTRSDFLPELGDVRRWTGGWSLRFLTGLRG